MRTRSKSIIFKPLFQKKKEETPEFPGYNMD